MDTLTELESFCRRSGHIGALMLTGEWGCGKTYLIDNELKKNLNDDSKPKEQKYLVVRISLFGMDSLEKIHEKVLETCILEEANAQGKGKIVNVIRKIWKNVKSFPVIKDWAEVNPLFLLSDNNTLFGKKIILVFDDLERTKLDTIEVLGCINEYCEKHFTVIIISNEKVVQQKYTMTNGKKNTADDEDQDNNIQPIGYKEIKEKIVERTILFSPDYNDIIPKILKAVGETEAGSAYSSFLNNKKVLEMLLRMFRDNEANEGFREKPHNLRVLRAALFEFSRIFKILNQGVEISEEYKKLSGEELLYAQYGKWLNAYVVGEMLIKAYGDFDRRESFLEKAENFYPEFQEEYLTKTEYQWITTGSLDEESFSKEIEAFNRRHKDISPKEKVLLEDMSCLDEATVREGYAALVNDAYDGKLTFDDYVNFIEKSRQYRMFRLSSDQPDWTKIIQAIRKKIEIETETEYGITIIEEEKKSLYLAEEYNAYKEIYKFRKHRVAERRKNRTEYLNASKSGFDALLLNCVGKQYLYFDSLMASETASCFQICTQKEKSRFADLIQKIWGDFWNWPEMDIVKTKEGFLYLKELLEEQKTKYEEENRGITVEHTNRVIQQICSLIEDCD